MLDRAEKNKECWDRLCLKESSCNNNNNNNNLAVCPDETECSTTKKPRLDVNASRSQTVKSNKQNTKSNGHHITSNGYGDNHTSSRDIKTNRTTHHNGNITSSPSLSNGHSSSSSSSSKSSLSTSQMFTCINESLAWATQGRDTNLAALADSLSVSYAGVPDCLKNASHIQVLVTGSLLLVGGVLTVVDPTMND